MYGLKEEITRLLDRVQSEVWYWDGNAGGLCEGDKVVSDEKTTLKNKIYSIFRCHGYMPHFNCKVMVSALENEINNSIVFVVVSIVWLDRHNKLDYILNFGLGDFVKI